MKRKIRIEVGSLSQALDRFERTWERAAKTGARGTEVRLALLWWPPSRESGSR
jgi:hypothetical protein